MKEKWKKKKKHTFNQSVEQKPTNRSLPLIFAEPKTQPNLQNFTLANLNQTWIAIFIQQWTWTRIESLKINFVEPESGPDRYF